MATTPPTHAKQRAALLESQRALNREALQNTSSPNSVYSGEFKKFRDWVHSQPVLDRVPLFSRDNVDLYFQRVVAYRRGKPENARKVVNALEWYCRFRYNDLPFVVESVDVTTALSLQKARGESTGNPGGDPLKGLKDAVSESDRIIIMSYIYRSRKDWDTASVNFSWCYQGAICGPSNHALTFSDLNLSHGFGAEKIGPLTCALLLYFCIRGMFTKTIMRKTNKYVRGNISSMLFSVLCFATACRILKTLRTMGDSINLYQRNKRERAKWWDTPLIDWQVYNGKCFTCFNVYT